MGVDCNGQGKNPAELVQNKFLKWLLGGNKYCNNNAYRALRAETGRFPSPTVGTLSSGSDLNQNKKANYPK